MSSDIEKLATIVNNGLLALGKKIDALASKKSEAPIVNLPPIQMPEMLPYPEFPPFPEMKAPIVNIPAPIVTVEKPDPVVVNVEPPIVNIPAPNITVTPSPVEFPKEMEVKGIKELGDKIDTLINQEVKNPIADINSKKPMAVMVVNKDGKQVNDFGGEFSAPNVVGLRIGTTILSASHPLPVAMGFQIPVYDTEVIDASLAPATTTITYKKSGVTVATKTIAVSGTTTTITVV